MTLWNVADFIVKGFLTIITIWGVWATVQEAKDER